MEGRDLEGRQLGGFLLGQTLGHGGFATVYRANQLRLDREVAVKVLDAELARNPDASRRFEREGRAAAKLDHPNIVPVYEAGEEDGVFFLAMRFVAGCTLADRLAERAPLDAVELLQIVAPLADALDHAHAHELVHRDVKPGNVLLEPRAGGTEWVWLTDFGIAATARDVGRYTSGALGTAWYMAPEQAEGREVDGRADLYALGCVVFECLTGQPPYPRDDLIASLMAHAQAPIPSIGDEALDGFFVTALAKDPTARFSSGHQLVDALTTAVGDVASPLDDRSPVGTTTVRTSPPTVVRPTPRPRVAVADDTVEVAVAPTSGENSPGLDGGAGGSGPVGRRRGVVVGTVAAVLALIVAGVTMALGGGDDDNAKRAAATTAPQTSAPETTTAPVVPAPAIESGGELDLALDTTLDDLDPHRVIDAEPLVTGTVLPPLYRVESDLTWVPHLAAGPPDVESEDPLTVRYSLRDDAVWDDGSSITTADVQATWDYVRDASVGAANLSLFERIDSVEIIDDQEFRVVFAEPFGRVEGLFSTLHPLISAQALADHLAQGGTRAEFLRDGISFSGGPFRLVDFVPGTSLKLVRNEAWWGEAAPLDEIAVRFYGDTDGVLEALESGAAQAGHVRYPQSGQATEIAETDGTVVLAGPSDLHLELVWNHRTTVGGDPLVRQAIAAALDRETLTDAQVTGVVGAPASPDQSLIYRSGQPESGEPFAGTRHDEGAASAALTEAGWAPGDSGLRERDGQQLIIRLLYPDEGPAELWTVQLFGALTGQLDDVGIGVQGLPVPLSDLDARLDAGAWDIYVDVAVVGPDPSKAYFAYGSGQAANLGGYSNPEVDALLDETERLAADQVARAERFRAVDEQLVTDLPRLPLYTVPAFLAHDCRLGGIVYGLQRGGPLPSLASWGWYEEEPQDCGGVVPVDPGG